MTRHFPSMALRAPKEGFSLKLPRVYISTDRSDPGISAATRSATAALSSLPRRYNPTRGNEWKRDQLAP
jgi:hypothetical protein